MGRYSPLALGGSWWTFLFETTRQEWQWGLSAGVLWHIATTTRMCMCPLCPLRPCRSRAGHPPKVLLPHEGARGRHSYRFTLWTFSSPLDTPNNQIVRWWWFNPVETYTSSPQGELNDWYDQKAPHEDAVEKVYSTCLANTKPLL